VNSLNFVFELTESVKQGLTASPVLLHREILLLFHAEHQTEHLPWASDTHVATSLMIIWWMVL
jgi:hypothetical protein